MGRKRLVISLDETEHATLMKTARDAGDTLSNWVRTALGLPSVRQGVKAPPPTGRKRVAKGK
jgi:hypothetical protein